MAVTITKQAEAYLEALAKALEIPPARYEQAERSYKSLGEWLHRDGSSVKNFGPDVFVQGSFRLPASTGRNKLAVPHEKLRARGQSDQSAIGAFAQAASGPY